MNHTYSGTSQIYHNYLDSENYKRHCANENRIVSQKLLKNYCQSRHSPIDNCQTTTNSNLRKEKSLLHHQSTFPINTNNLSSDSSNNITSFTQSSKVTTFPITNHSTISLENLNISQKSYSSFGNNLSTTSFNNFVSLNNNTSFLISKKIDNIDNKLEEENNNNITRPVIQSPLNMLHRSPSGAARRIRQRREENSQRQFPILSSPNSSSFNNRSFQSEPVVGTLPSRQTMIEGDNEYVKNDSSQMDYRDLMNSSSYKSILPEDDFNISYSRPPQRILCNNSTFTSNASKAEDSGSEESSYPETMYTTPTQFQEIDHNIVTMESNKFLDKIDFSSLLSTTTTTTTTTTPPTNDEYNQPKVIVPPVPPKRTSLASSGDGSSYSSYTKTTGTVNNNISNDHKPIIEVHPMPVPRKSHIQCEESLLSVEKNNDKKIPPPLPKKPSKFIFKGEANSPIIFKSTEPYYSHNQSYSSPIPPSPSLKICDQYKESPMVRQRFDSLPSLSSSNTPHGNNKENERNNESSEKESTYNNLFIKNQNGTSSLSMSTSNLYSSAYMSTSTTVSSAQSTESLNQLFTSPSMLSLQNAYKNYPLMTEQDLEMLEEKRKNLVESLSRKMRVLEEEKVMIDEDIYENEEFKKRFFQKIDFDPQMLMRLNNHIAQAKTLSLLETKINLQLERLDNYLTNENDVDPSLFEFCQTRKNRLTEQLSDSSMLRNLHRSRDVEIENILSSKYFLQPEQMDEWRIYKDSLVRLLTEKRQMEDRLSQAKHQLAILDTLALQASALMKNLSTSNIHGREISSGGSSMISSSDNSRANTLDSGEIIVGDLRSSNTINNNNNNTSTALIV
ncbi:Apx/shroom, ASD2 domain-containing protein [Strongyloides ratti]|uniref:Apx/shroom, ASD2 domain-containing protein n=1 Tax=Strongyloides ratti TaxID=34506 RepID=A0A090LE41_STRRB|nr:Apx/shroom, ASD2 domain-containing protein [Strongyloides ratti]CEF65745.1 Apx/shroom, ASD2 domain-containing protein [Strongyloides ratti]